MKKGAKLNGVKHEVSTKGGYAPAPAVGLRERADEAPLTEDERTVMSTLERLQSLRTALDIVPKYITSTRLRRNTAHLNASHFDSALASLEERGLIERRRGLNHELYALKYHQKEDAMNVFEQTIKAFLDGKAASDPEFAARYAKEGKSIEQCCRYIIGEVKKSRREGFADEEVYGMAVHYYDEDEVKVEDAGKCTVVVNHEIRLTEEQKREIEEKARKELEAEELRKAREKLAAEREKAERKAREAEQKAKEEQERKRKEAEQDGMLFLFNE